MIRRDTHGGNVHAVARERHRPLGQIIDFSASINPLGPSPRAIRALKAAVSELVHYPDPDCVEVREALSRRHQLPADQFVIGNGSTELIHLLPAVLKIDHALVIGPTFSEYARAVLQHDGQVAYVHAHRSNHFTPPIEEAMAALERTGPKFTAVVLCNPNSPTGQAVSRRSVRDLVHAASKQGIWVIVDETFAEYHEDCSVLSEVSRQPHLLVLRSFTKFFALPGLRIGYAAGPRGIIARLHSAQPTWSVNSLAQAAVSAALSDTRHAARSLRFMGRERERLRQRLHSLSGLVVYPSTANFLLLELPFAWAASRLETALRDRGVLIRDCSSVPGLNARTVRVAVRSSKDNDRLVRLLEGMLT
jgi:threonine-phosphate decarboxylase